MQICIVHVQYETKYVIHWIELIFGYTPTKMNSEDFDGTYTQFVFN